VTQHLHQFSVLLKLQATAVLNPFKLVVKRQEDWWTNVQNLTSTVSIGYKSWSGRASGKEALRYTSEPNS
jgi:hypothetical protein